MARAYQVHPQDNVATMLEDSSSGEIQIFGASTCSIHITTSIRLGHKVALTQLKTGDAVIKYGVRIGHSTQMIQVGEWVHLHNLSSDLDERSGTLDGETGTPTDTRYA